MKYGKTYLSKALAVTVILGLALCLPACGKDSTDDTGVPTDDTTAIVSADPTQNTATGPTNATTPGTTTADGTQPSHGEHTFGDWIVKTAATCKFEGVQIRRCSQCDLEETRPVAKLAHTLDAQNICKKC